MKFPEKYKNLDAPTKNKARKIIADYYYGSNEEKEAAKSKIYKTGAVFNSTHKPLDGNDTAAWGAAWLAASDYAADMLSEALGAPAQNNPGIPNAPQVPTPATPLAPTMEDGGRLGGPDPSKH